LRRDFQRIAPDLDGIMLDPTRLWKDLFVLFLSDSDGLARCVEQY
jgi:hypothetical protein